MNDLYMKSDDSPSAKADCNLCTVESWKEKRDKREHFILL